MMDYLIELTQDEPKQHMRPNFFVNTPDINPIYLQTSGRPGFIVRATLASTLSPLYGVYSGFELCEGTPIPGKEEYLDSEKFEVKAWDWDRPGNIRAEIARLNRIRRENPALQRFTNLEFMQAWNDNVMVYAKTTENKDNAVLIGRQHGPAPRAGLPLRGAVVVFRARRQRHDRGRGPAAAAPLSLERQDAARLARPAPTTPVAIWRLIPPGMALNRHPRPTSARTKRDVEA